MGMTTIEDVIKQLMNDYGSEGLKYEPTEYGIGFRFKDEWYNLSGYNFLAQLDILTTALQPLLK